MYDENGPKREGEEMVVFSDVMVSVTQRELYELIADRDATREELNRLKAKVADVSADETEWMAAQQREADARSIIAVGDVVALKSGGPEMTVVDVKEDSAMVRWFLGDVAHFSMLPLACVRKVTK